METISQHIRSLYYNNQFYPYQTIPVVASYFNATNMYIFEMNSTLRLILSNISELYQSKFVGHFQPYYTTSKLYLVLLAIYCIKLLSKRSLKYIVWDIFKMLMFLVVIDNLKLSSSMTFSFAVALTTDSPSYAPTATAHYLYLGCYGDNNPRAMTKLGKINSMLDCYYLAYNQGYSLYGLQYGSECWVSNNLTKAERYGQCGTCTTCAKPTCNCANMQCPNGIDNCGDGWANALYMITASPTSMPSSQPIYSPSMVPTKIPTYNPSVLPSLRPIPNPTPTPTFIPSVIATNIPSLLPSSRPSLTPSSKPTLSTNLPSCSPSNIPTNAPTFVISYQYVGCYGDNIIRAMDKKLGNVDSIATCYTLALFSGYTIYSLQYGSECWVSINLTRAERYGQCGSCTTCKNPTCNCANKKCANGDDNCGDAYANEIFLIVPVVPSVTPSFAPSTKPTKQPSISPSYLPSMTPSYRPSFLPTNNPSFNPTVLPSCKPTSSPLYSPTAQPSTSTPSVIPSIPTFDPTSKPSYKLSFMPSTLQPSFRPSLEPTDIPTIKPTMEPSSKPTIRPSKTPSAKPTFKPSIEPTLIPSVEPSISQIPTYDTTYEPTNAVKTIEPTTSSGGGSINSATISSTDTITIISSILSFCCLCWFCILMGFIASRFRKGKEDKSVAPMKYIHTTEDDDNAAPIELNLIVKY